MSKNMKPRRNDPNLVIHFAAVNTVLQMVNDSELDQFRSETAAAGFKYVSKWGEYYTGTMPGIRRTLSWENPRTCAAEMLLLTSVNHPLRVAYDAAYAALTKNKANTSTSALALPPKQAKIVAAMDAARTAGDLTKFQELVAELADVTAQMPPEAQQAVIAARTPAPAPAPTPAPKPAKSPKALKVPKAVATLTSNTSAPIDLMAIHAYATQKARQEFVRVLTNGDQTLMVRFPALRVSVDYAVLQGTIAYWFHWITEIAKLEGLPIESAFSLEHPTVAVEAKKLLLQGIPCDFLFYASPPHAPLVNPNDPNGVPLTGMPVTPKEAAYLALLRPPTWHEAWAPLPAGPLAPQDDPGPIVDYFFGYDPAESIRTGEPQELAIPKHMNNERYPVLEVADAFLVWGLACSGKLDKSLYLPVREAANRVGEYTDHQVTHVFGVSTDMHSFNMLRQHYQMRRDAGEPEDEIIQDLGQPPLMPVGKSDWKTYSRELKTAAIKAIPVLVSASTLPVRIHARPTFAYFNVFEELPRLTSGGPEWEDDAAPWGG